MMDELLFTPAALMDLLMKIEELSDYDIELTESGSGILLTVGDSHYEINPSGDEDVVVPEEAIDEIRDIKDAAYDELEDVEVSDDVTSGVIKELFKSLLVGGMVRLTTKMLRR